MNTLSSKSSLKSKLASGSTVYGTFFHWVNDPAIIEMIPDSTLDFVVVNVEHNALDLADFLGMQFALQTKNIACLVRVHSRDTEDIARICDTFPDGVVVPYVEDIEELERIVAAAKYRPLKGAALARVIASGEWPGEKTMSYQGLVRQGARFLPFSNDGIWIRDGITDFIGAVSGKVAASEEKIV